MEKKKVLNAIKNNIKILDYFFYLEQQKIIKYTHSTVSDVFFTLTNKNQSTGSIAVKKRKELYYDFSTGKGGDVITAMQEFENKTIVEILNSTSIQTENDYNNRENIRIKNDVDKKVKEKSKMEIVKVNKKITNPALLMYMKTRKIKLSTIYNNDIPLYEIYTTNGTNSYFYLGLECDKKKEIYALRNKYIKGNINGSCLYHSIRKGKALAIFEGMFDAFSYLELNPKKTQENDILILNSLAHSYNRQFEEIITKYINVEIYLDNDIEGKKRTEQIIEKYSNYINFNQLIINYTKYKDLNEYHCKTSFSLKL